MNNDIQSLNLAINAFLGDIDKLNQSFRERFKAKEFPRIWEKAARICKIKCDKQIEELSNTTLFPPEALKVYLRDILLGINEKYLLKSMEAELGDIEYLDKFKKSVVGYSKAYGPKYIVNIFSATLGPQIISTFQSAVVKSPCICKPSSKEPLFTKLWIESLIEVEPELGKYIRVFMWKGGNKEIEKKIFGEEDSAVIVYGDEQTIKDISSICKGVVLSYPQRMGFEIITPETEENLESICNKIAIDIAYFDQKACFSPHVIYVLKDKNFAKNLAKGLAVALEKINIPRSEPSVDEKAVISMLKSTSLGEKVVGLPIEVYAGKDYTVIYEEDPSFQGSPLCRTIRVKPIDCIERLAILLKKYAGYFQTVGTNLTNNERVADLLQPLGVSRITEIGKVLPEYLLHHEGRYQLLPLLKWIDIEKNTLNSVNREEE